MRKLFLFLAIVIYCASSFGQVNPQTGGATFGLPMFSWKDDKSRLSSDVALTYNSGSGLRVNDMATNVGQGWNMIAGGVISRMQVGEPDDQKGYNGLGSTAYDDLTKYPPGYLYNNMSPLNGCPQALTKYPLFESRNQLYKQHNTVAADRELDRFSFQINGRSGIFVLGKNNGDKCILFEDSKLKIWFVRNEAMATNTVNQGIRTTISAFYIQDENGLIYRFDKIERTKTLKTNFCDENLNQSYTQPKFKNGNVYNQSNFDNNDIVNPYVINSWYLTEIKDPLTLRVVSISYNAVNNNIYAKGPSGITYFGEKDYAIVSNNFSKTETPVIKSIVYPDGHIVTFNYGDARVDLSGDNALASVDITYQGRSLSRYELNTGYFVLNRIATPATDFQKSVARLCLRSVKKYGIDLKGDEPPYLFDYYIGGNNSSSAAADASGVEDIVPPPYFHLKDIWGFYNGNNSTHWGSANAIPIYTPLSKITLDQARGLCFTKSGTSNITYNAKDGYAKNGLLKRIIYPTGGNISYTYEQTEGILNGVATKMAGVHVSATSVSDGGYSNDCSTNPIVTNYSYKESNLQSSLWGIETPVRHNQVTSYYKPEYKKYKFPFSCTYKFKYPGIISREEAISLTGGQQFLIALSQVADIVSNVMMVVDIINVCLDATPFVVVAIVIDIIGAIYSFISTCLSNPVKDDTTTVYFNSDLNSANPLPMQYRRVVVKESGGGNGSTVMEFTSPMEYGIWAVSNPYYAMRQRYATYAYGLPLITTIKDKDDNIIKQTENSYSYPSATNDKTRPKFGGGVATLGDPSCKCVVLRSVSQRITDWNDPVKYNDPLSFITDVWTDTKLKADIYGTTFGHAQLDSTIERVKKSGINQFLKKTTSYLYNSNNYQIKEIISTESDAAKETHKILKYSGDFSTGVLNTLNQANILSQPVSSATYLLNKTNITNPTFDLLEEKVTEFTTVGNGGIMPYRTLEQRFKQPLSKTALWLLEAALYQGAGSASNPPYIESQTMTYDAVGNVIGLKDEGNHVVTNVYGYNNKYVIATVVNAAPVADKVAYTSFEDGNFNGWAVAGISSVATTTSVTGSNSLLLGVAGNTVTTISLTGLTAGKTYTISYWSNAGTMTVPNSTLLKSSPTINGYTYYEYSFTPPATTLTITSSAIKNIDELRLYPQLSRMRTVTYDPLIGKTSECDENNRLTYYEYDELGRLKFLKDDYKNTVKMYEYNYAKLPANCNTAFSNAKISEVFYKNNCVSNQIPQPYVFTIAAGNFTSTVSQDVVDQLVENYINANGQNTANANGTCILVHSNTIQTGTFQKDNCAAGYIGSNVTYTVPASRYKSLISDQDANDKARDEIYANGQLFANNSSSSNCTISTVPDWTSTDNSYCVVGTNGLYNGQVMIQFKDLNPNSATFNQFRWEAADASVSQACSGVAQLTINLLNFTSTPTRIIFTNTSDGLKYYDNTVGASYSGAFILPAGNYDVSVAPVAGGSNIFRYKLGSSSSISVTGTSVSNLLFNANSNIYIDGTVFNNIAVSRSFTKSDCPSGTSALVTYTIPYGMYTSTSQTNADALANTDLTNNGQFYADVNGVCAATPPPAITGNTYFTYGYPYGNGSITAQPGSTVNVSISANGGVANGFSLSVSIPGVTITGSTSVTMSSSTFSFVMPASGMVNWSANFTAASSAGGGSISVY